MNNIPYRSILLVILALALGASIVFGGLDENQTSTLYNAFFFSVICLGISGLFSACAGD